MLYFIYIQQLIYEPHIYLEDDVRDHPTILLVHPTTMSTYRVGQKSGPQTRKHNSVKC